MWATPSGRWWSLGGLYKAQRNSEGVEVSLGSDGSLKSNFKREYTKLGIRHRPGMVNRIISTCKFFT